MAKARRSTSLFLRPSSQSLYSNSRSTDFGSGLRSHFPPRSVSLGSLKHLPADPERDFYIGVNNDQLLFSSRNSRVLSVTFKAHRTGDTYLPTMTPKSITQPGSAGQENVPQNPPNFSRPKPCLRRRSGSVANHTFEPAPGSSLRSSSEFAEHGSTGDEGEINTAISQVSGIKAFTLLFLLPIRV